MWRMAMWRNGYVPGGGGVTNYLICLMSVMSISVRGGGMAKCTFFNVAHVSVFLFISVAVVMTAGGGL